MSRAIESSDLVGAWHLDDFVIRFADGRPPVRPFGADARGQLVYTADGHMSATLCRAERAPLGEGLEASYKASPEAKAHAFDGYMAYAGRWRLDGDTVVHDVHFALTPELVGRQNRRSARFEGGRLHLSYRLTARSGIERTYTLTWRRP